MIHYNVFIRKRSFEMQQRKYNKSDFIEAFDRMLDNVPYNEIDVKSLCFEVVNEPSRKVFIKTLKINKTF